MEKIIVWGEHTPCAAAAVRWAVAQAAETGAEVVVVRPLDHGRRADLRLEVDLAQARRDARFRAQSWVVDVVADLEDSVPVAVSTPEDSVESALTAAAAGALMLVIGAEHEHQRDVARVVAATCACPVVVLGADRAVAPA
jgi:hypothetical protein